MNQHRYETQIEWSGNDGSGTASYQSYRRDYTISAAGKPSIAGSSDPAFLGDPARYNPEELLVAALSACHMLWYLHLCSAQGITVLEYRDEAFGIMQEARDGSGAFISVQLRPKVRIAAPGDAEESFSIHEEAHRLCYIARSVNFPVSVAPELL